MSQQFIIRYAGKYPVRVVKNVAGCVFDLTSAERATRFPTEAAGREAAVKHGVRGHFTVEPQNTQQLQNFLTTNQERK